MTFAPGALPVTAFAIGNRVYSWAHTKRTTETHWEALERVLGNLEDIDSESKVKILDEDFAELFVMRENRGPGNEIDVLQAVLDLTPEYIEEDKKAAKMEGRPLDRRIGCRLTASQAKNHLFDFVTEYQAKQAIKTVKEDAATRGNSTNLGGSCGL